MIGAATLGVLAAAAEERPVCVLVDDAHRLDEPSAEAILFAARRLLADPVAIIVGVRSSEASPFAGADLPELALTGLDLGAAEALLAHERDDAVPAGSAERLFRATGGNPLALIELAGEAESVAASLVEGPLPIATTVERAFAGRVSRLSEMARRSLLVASAAANTELGVLAEAAAALGIEIAALQEAEAAGLVVVTDGSIEFRHPLVRSAVHNAAEPAERRAAHGALAAAMSDPRLADERAWHLGEAAFGPDETAAGALADAAERARERGAYAAAALTAERAARLSAAVDVRGRRLLDAASNAWVAGSGERAVQLLDEAAPLAADDDVAVEIASLRGHVSLARGDAMAAREIFMQAARLAAPDGRRSALLWAEASFASFCAGRVGPMLDDARAACAALDREDEGVEACTAQLALGMALVFCGAGDEGPRAIRSAIAMAGYAQLLTGPPLAWRWALEAPLFLREARTARESSGARSSLRAIAASRVPSARCSSCWRATRPRPIAGARLARATTRPPSWPSRRGSRARSAQRSRASPGSRRARGERRPAAHMPPGRSSRRGSSAAASTRPGRSLRWAISSSRSDALPRPSIA